MSTLGDGWRLAVGTLTAIPVRPPSRVDRPVAAAAMLLAPVAALPLALAPLLAHGAVRWLGMPPLLAAALTVAALGLGSRGLHLDGLADTADGLAASYDRARALEVMRLGNVGPAGAAALVITLLVQFAALSALVATWAGAVLAAIAVVGSRHTLAWVCTPWFPAARPGGLGATVAGSVSRGWAALAFVGLVGLSVVAVLAFAALSGASGAPGALTMTRGGALGAAVVLLAGVVAAVAVGLRARLRLGGVTGDVLGAGVELGLTVALTVAACL